MPKFTKSRTNSRFSSMTEETGIPQGNLNPAAPPFHTITTPTLPLIQLQTPTTAQLETTIRRIVQQVLTSTNDTELVDETITDNANLGYLDKIPDLVKTIREFQGERTEYSAWRKSVDRVFELYGHTRGTAKYFGIISCIRNKIIGNANVALESYNTPLNWTAIKKCLNTHYTDRRDIGTLEYQLTTLVQGRNSIENFYQKVYSHLSMMLNNISSMELDRNTEKAFISSYRNKALDTFIRGLNGDLPNLLAVREPTDLPEALHLCTRLANQNFRTNYANTQGYGPPQVQQRRPTNTHQNTFTNAKFQNKSTTTNQPTNNHMPINYYPNNHNHQSNNYPPMPQFRTQNYIGNFNPNQFQQTQNSVQPANPHPQSNNPPPRPSAPKPRNYQPMEVDHSLHSKVVNYANRPQGQNWSTQQNKQPNFNMQARNNTEQNETFATYLQQYEAQCENERDDQQEAYNSDYIDTTDVHFLD